MTRKHHSLDSLFSFTDYKLGSSTRMVVKSSCFTIGLSVIKGITQVNSRSWTVTSTRPSWAALGTSPSPWVSPGRQCRKDCCASDVGQKEGKGKSRHMHWNHHASSHIYSYRRIGNSACYQLTLWAGAPAWGSCLLSCLSSVPEVPELAGQSQVRVRIQGFPWRTWDSTVILREMHVFNLFLYISSTFLFL